MASIIVDEANDAPGRARVRLRGVVVRLRRNLSRSDAVSPRPASPSPAAAAELCTTGPSCARIARENHRARPFAREAHRHERLRRRRLSRLVHEDVRESGPVARRRVRRGLVRAFSRRRVADPIVDGVRQHPRAGARRHHDPRVSRRGGVRVDAKPNDVASRGRPRRISMTRAIVRDLGGPDGTMSSARSVAGDVGGGMARGPARCRPDASATDHSAIREQRTSAARRAGAHYRARRVPGGCRELARVSERYSPPSCRSSAGQPAQVLEVLSARLARRGGLGRLTSSTAASCSALRRCARTVPTAESGRRRRERTASFPFASSPATARPFDSSAILRRRGSRRSLPAGRASRASSGQTQPPDRDACALNIARAAVDRAPRRPRARARTPERRMQHHQRGCRLRRRGRRRRRDRRVARLLRAVRHPRRSGREGATRRVVAVEEHPSEVLVRASRTARRGRATRDRRASRMRATRTSREPPFDVATTSRNRRGRVSRVAALPRRRWSRAPTRQFAASGAGRVSRRLFPAARSATEIPCLDRGPSTATSGSSIRGRVRACATCPRTACGRAHGERSPGSIDAVAAATLRMATSQRVHASVWSRPAAESTLRRLRLRRRRRGAASR